MPEPLLQVTDLRVEFAGARPVRAVRGLSYELAPGEALGLVGESGSGKSVSALSLLRLLPAKTARITSGTARFDGIDLLALPIHDLEDLRGDRIGFVFQDPLVYLNPVLTVGEQITESLRRHRGASKREAAARAAELLTLVGIPNAAARLADFPHQFSGGMQQRAMIALALASGANFLIADEPTTALDVTIQSQILRLLKRLRDTHGLTILLITHDLGVVAQTCDRVGVLYAGTLVETTTTGALFRDPKHPYTQGLLGALPRPGSRGRDLAAIEGQVPSGLAAVAGCPFAARCPRVFEPCRLERPALLECSPGHLAACHLYTHVKAAP